MRRLRILLTIALVTLAASPTAAGLINEARGVPPEVRAYWNRAGSAVCPQDYDYVARIRRCVSRAAMSGAVPAQRNRRGSAVCPADYDYVARYRTCLPRQ
jgi:hypothetical protein